MNPLYSARSSTAPVAARLAAGVLRATNAALRAAGRLAWIGRVPEAPRRLCVWRTGNIGDLVCALPALAALRVTWPEAELTLLTSPGEPGAPGAKELLRDAPWIDHLWVYHPRELQARRFARELRARDFDLVVRLPQNMGTPLRELRDLVFLRFLVRVRHARGFAVGNLRWLGRSPARALASHPALEHESDRLLALLRGVSVPTSGAEFPLPLTAEVRAEADRLLAAHGLASGRLLCLSPGAKRSTNRWPLEHFAYVAARWARQGKPVAVLGSASEAPLAAKLRELAGHPVSDLCASARAGPPPAPFSSPSVHASLRRAGVG